MPNYSRSTLIVPDELPAYKTDAEDAPPFVWDTVQRTVIKILEPLLCQQAIAPAHSAAALAAMQRLVVMINTLRSSSLSSLDGASKRWLSEAQTLEALLPYVSEEAYDVLEALREEGHLEAAISGQRSAVSSSPHPFSTIDTLIPSLLWELARSSYSAMQLIEGVRAKCWQPEQGWSCGMLRLVVMLEAEAPMARWCFDLATGYPAETLLELDAIVQTDECVLPLRQTAAAKDRDGTIDAAYQVDHQLAAIVQSLKAERLGLKPLLQGVAVELLQPGSGWQAGNLRLRLGFTFSTQTPTAGSHEGVPMHPELIEAELMEEAIGSNQGNPLQPSASLTRTIAVVAKTHLSVVNLLGRTLSPTTLVRVTDADPLDRYTQLMTQRQFAQSLCQLQSQQTNADDESVQLTLIVQAAIACAHQLSTPGTGLLQPMLLMDELVPQLLWSLTSSTYEIMQLLGGIPAHVLQPNAQWEKGTLRLLAALHLKATDVDYTLDLSTGRSVLINTTRLASDAIVHANITVCSQQPTSIATLIAHLEQQLDDAMLAYSLFQGGVSITWLEDVEQDWQTGSMQISLSLAFVADAL